MKTLACLVLLSCAALAADFNVTGTWKGTATMSRPGGADSREGPAMLVLKQDGATVTGSGGPDEQRSQPIQNGKIDGDTFTFELQTADKPIVFKMKLVDGRLKGSGSGAPGGQTMSVALDLRKE